MKSLMTGLDIKLKSLGIPIDGVSSGSPIRIDFRPEATAEQIADAEALAATWDQAQADAVELVQLKQQSKQVFADVSPDPQPWPRAARAILALLLQDCNLLAAKINAILDAVDAASNLAGLKTAVAAIADAPVYTAAQVRQAVRDKVDEE